MCGRFSLTTPGELIAEAFGLEEAPELRPRYNVAPTQPVLAVRSMGWGRALVPLRWGLVGAATRDPSAAPPVINARAETVMRKPAFRDAFQRRRCLIPADGFYEWRRLGATRQPVHFSMSDGSVFGLAGLWAPDTLPGGGTLGSCVVLTTEPNELVGDVHDRMPVILRPESFARWLDPVPAPAEELAALLRPYASERMRSRDVDLYVNDVRHEGPDCLRPPRQQQGRLF